MTPTNYLRNKEKRNNTLFRIVNGRGFYITKEMAIPEKEFNAIFPLPLKIKMPDASGVIKNDIDGRRKWMGD